jgi:hypothetical protein
MVASRKYARLRNQVLEKDDRWEWRAEDGEERERERERCGGRRRRKDSCV